MDPLILSTYNMQKETEGHGELYGIQEENERA